MQAGAETTACWRLDTTGQTLVLASTGGRLPAVVYWGGRLEADEDLAALAAALARPLGHGTLDHVPDLSIAPEEGRGFQGEPGIRLADHEGRPLFTQFTLTHVRTEGHDLRVEAEDAGLRLTYHAVFRWTAGSAVIETEARVENRSGRPMRLEWLSAPVLPLPAEADDIIEFAGRWTQEFGERRVAIARGVHLRQSRRGRTGHDHFPAVIVPDRGAGESVGEARALHLGFSGAHRLLVEELATGQRQVQAGIAEAVTLAAGEAAGSGTAHLAFSREGLNGIAHAYQTHVRRAVVAFPDPARPRPVHYNCWEAVYFRHDLDELKDLASRAAGLGAERFVLDDGWFGSKDRGRDDDTSSLGDWDVDPRKYPDGLAPLIAHVESLGMRFGLWVEPEMVNPDSDLARAHPDWMIAPPGRRQTTGRGQHVLDLSNPAVGEHLFARLDALLSQHAVDCLKWDMNRDLTLAADRAGHGLLRRQTAAVYALIDRLRAAHPAVEIESCASGGARIDYGILRRTHRVWLSDSNDAHERWRMQHAAMLFLPPEIVGSHVGPRHCHTSGRRLSMAFRAGVAMTGHMGLEMDLRELEAQEEAVLRRHIRLYKDNRGWLHAARQHRLVTRAEHCAHVSVDPERTRFLLFHGTLAVPEHESATPVRLAGLDADRRYRIRLVNRTDGPVSANRRPHGPLLRGEEPSVSGRALMQSGLVLPFALPDTLWIVEGCAI